MMATLLFSLTTLQSIEAKETFYGRYSLGMEDGQLFVMRCPEGSRCERMPNAPCELAIADKRAASAGMPLPHYYRIFGQYEEGRFGFYGDMPCRVTASALQLITEAEFEERTDSGLAPLRKEPAIRVPR